MHIKAIANMSAEAISPEHMTRISHHLDNWDNADFEDRRLVVDGLISQIRATSESVQMNGKSERFTRNILLCGLLYGV